MTRILFIDNHDSFSYNLIAYFKQLALEVVIIEYHNLNPSCLDTSTFEAIVISPGPGKPSDYPKLFTLLDKIHQNQAILGICLGHQLIAEYFNSIVGKAKKPLHGITSNIFHNSNLFSNITQGTQVMRYHSLIIELLGKDLSVIASTQENEIMAIQHNSLPIIGFQFHPESILTVDGYTLLSNWVKTIR